jgi:hypothetical protein
VEREDEEKEKYEGKKNQIRWEKEKKRSGER